MAIAGLILGYVTLVLNVVFVIPVVLFSGAKAWKEGADRSACIMNQRNIEQMIQGYANLYNVEVGDSLDLDEIKEEFDMQHMNDACPMGGTLTISSTYLGPNESHVSCSKEDHKFNYDFSP